MPYLARRLLLLPHHSQYVMYLVHLSTFIDTQVMSIAVADAVIVSRAAFVSTNCTQCLIC